MASEENHDVFPEDDLDDDEDESEEEEQDQEDDVLGEENDDALLEEDEDLNSASSADPTTVTIAVPPPLPTITTTAPELDRNSKRQRVEEIQIGTVQGEKKLQQQQQQPLDEARRLFQRLWTDEDEIELLQGFLDYSTQRGTSQNHHHDTAAFYDQIKSKLQLDFNKNQLVEKLRRLKKKYRNVVNRISSGKEFVFKSPHDQATFEISRKIWSNLNRSAGEIGGLDDEDGNLNLNPNQNPNSNSNFNYTVSHNNSNDGVDLNSGEKKGQKSRKRSRVKIEEKRVLDEKVMMGSAVGAATVSGVSSIPGLVEETVRSCLSPLFKELLNNAMNGPCSSGMVRGFGGGGGMLSPLPLSFGGGNLLGGEVVDEKWRKQQILELEVYSKRLELVQDQIKATLEELRSTGS